MKATFFKSTMPFAAAVVIGLSGAFLTTSMQSVSKAAPRDGYIEGLSGKCSVKVECTDNDTPICQANGQQAFGDNANCDEVLHMPN